MDVDSGAQAVGYLIKAAVYDSPLVVPGRKNGLNRHEQLFPGVLRKSFSLIFDNNKIAVNNLLQRLGFKLHIACSLIFRFYLFQQPFKEVMVNLQNYFSKHLNKAAVAVQSKAAVVALPGEGLHRLIIETQVQYSIHHAGHGGTGAGADGHQEGIVDVAKLLAGNLLCLVHRLVDLLFHLGGNGLAIRIILGAGFRGHGEALGHGQPDVDHLRQVGTLAAQQVAHGGIPLGEQVYIFRHSFSSLVDFTLQWRLPRRTPPLIIPFLTHVFNASSPGFIHFMQKTA